MCKGPRQVQVVMILESVNAKLKTLLEINVILVRQIIMVSQIAKVLARFLALVTTMVTKFDHGNQGWLPRLVTMVSYLGY